ncbi:hypothetical protein F511_28627 [Dorcoceras hygrometricum]|uniref:Uncharacterized protein n=1 Tax=Dorcoceras hygrometricum TaxID=472368 RepID=A0A2Z7BNJ2_9LAMI|nr:hypothetical protein F511_28627 [Dorcoceras hygrometricum]
MSCRAMHEDCQGISEIKAQRQLCNKISINHQNPNHNDSASYRDSATTWDSRARRLSRPNHDSVIIRYQRKSGSICGVRSSAHSHQHNTYNQRSNSAHAYKLTFMREISELFSFKLLSTNSSQQKLEPNDEANQLRAVLTDQLTSNLESPSCFPLSCYPQTAHSKNSNQNDEANQLRAVLTDQLTSNLVYAKPKGYQQLTPYP